MKKRNCDRCGESKDAGLVHRCFFCQNLLCEPECLEKEINNHLLGGENRSYAENRRRQEIQAIKNRAMNSGTFERFIEKQKRNAVLNEAEDRGVNLGQPTMKDKCLDFSVALKLIRAGEISRTGSICLKPEISASGKHVDIYITSEYKARLKYFAKLEEPVGELELKETLNLEDYEAMRCTDDPTIVENKNKLEHVFWLCGCDSCDEFMVGRNRERGRETPTRLVDMARQWQEVTTPDIPDIGELT